VWVNNAMTTVFAFLDDIDPHEYERATEGRREERKGEAKDELARDQEKADRKAEEVANLERKTSWRERVPDWDRRERPSGPAIAAPLLSVRPCRAVVVLKPVVVGLTLAVRCRARHGCGWPPAPGRPPCCNSTAR
jgi:hypothetical protein